jgi:hypothetical protein
VSDVARVHRSKHTVKNMIKTQGVIPLFKRRQWPQWQKLCPDMTSSHNVWLKQHREMLKDFTARGIVVTEVEVDIDAYIFWASAKKLLLNGETRTLFAIYTRSHSQDDQSNN